MNAFLPAFSGRGIPDWYSWPHCEVPVTATLMLGSASIADIEATVTVYRDPEGEWAIGSMSVDGWQHKATVKVPVAQDDRGWTVTLPGYLADAIIAEVDRPETIARIEEALADAEEGWRA